MEYYWECGGCGQDIGPVSGTCTKCGYVTASYKRELRKVKGIKLPEGRIVDELWVVAVKPKKGVPQASKILGGAAKDSSDCEVASYFFDTKEGAEEYAREMNSLIKVGAYGVYRALVQLENVE